MAAGAWTSFDRAVAALEKRGIPIPDEYHALKARLSEYGTIRTPMRAKLIEAVLAGDGDVESLRSQALAETVTSREIDEAVRDAVRRRCREVYNVVAADVYNEVAKRFDVAAAELMKCCKVISPEADPAEVVTADDKTRRAYTDGQAAAKQLSELIDLLQIAAELAGAERPHNDQPDSSELHDIGIDMMQLGLTVRFDGHVRRLWESWSSDGPRTGSQWPALLELGATIKAVPLNEYAPQRRARPLLERREVVADDTYGEGDESYRPAMRTITRVIDPEDEEVPPPDDVDGAFKPQGAPEPVADPFEVRA
ncbi:hypothetical protein DDJ72_04060 [Mycobacteroides abscessus]|nr:hypothetical protein DDJ72_04060 [Mycobacteroides abscessus]